MQLAFLRQHLFAPGAGTVDEDGRVDAFFRDLPIQVQLHVAGAFELLVDHLVHAGAGVDQGGGENGQAAAFFDVARRAEKPFWPLQGVGVDAPCQHLAGGRHHGVVGPGQASDGIQQYDHILLVFGQPFRLLDDHFRHLHMPRRRLVEGAGDHLAPHQALHFRDFFRPLVYEQHD